jgi:Protein of unknown function (DUF2281)
MNEHLRDRILRKLETLPDERAYEVLDFAEFLESRYADRAAPPANAFTRFTDAIEDKLRAGRVSASAISETMSFMNRAASVLNNALETGKSVASELVSPAARRGFATPPGPVPGPPPSPPASSPAGDTPAPGSGEEKL